MVLIARNFRYLWANTKITINGKIVYRMATFLSLISQIVILSVSYCLWNSIYDGAKEINGFMMKDMINYLVLTFALSNIFPFSLSSKYGRMIKDGTIAMNIMKPISIEWQLFSESIGELLYNILLKLVPIMIFSWLFFGFDLSFSWLEALLALSFVALSYSFIFYLELLIGSLAYYTESIWGINNFKTSIVSLLSGRFLPISLYPEFFRKILRYIPFFALYDLPIELLLFGKKENLGLPYLIIIGSIFLIYILYKVVSQKTMKHMMIQGG